MKQAQPRGLRALAVKALEAVEGGGAAWAWPSDDPVWEASGVVRAGPRRAAAAITSASVAAAAVAATTPVELPFDIASQMSRRLQGMA